MIFSSTSDSNKEEVVVQKSKRGRKPNSLNKKTLVQNKINMIVTTESTTNSNSNQNDIDNNANQLPNTETETETKPPLKKRGRKPKGGKIIHNIVVDNSNKIQKPNIILHLKCFLKDLDSQITNNVDNIDSYKFPSKNNLLYDDINDDSNLFANVCVDDKQKPNNKVIHVINSTYNPNIETNNVTNTYCKSEVSPHTNTYDTKEIYKKLKDLEINLHLNNVQDKKSACFWCTCDFDNPPIYIPKYFLTESYHVYGCFCTPECGVAYLMNESIDSSTKFERYHLMNHIYAKIYNYTKNIKPAPSPYYMLEKYYGNLSINEYRALIRNDRLFLIVDKPLTRIMPELHIDNEDFIINNKIISTNNFQVTKKSHQKT
uniref:MYM-type domain-containing protein n=1 Tax=viral metagenome TaxID=1070528 RepID=A0A6C0E315_9ZZZZ